MLQECDMLLQEYDMLLQECDMLLQEYDMLFCETSAKSGRGVQESVQAMARYVIFKLKINC